MSADGRSAWQEDEQGLTAFDAALAEDDVPPDEEACGWVDLGTGMPVELMALSGQELQEVYAATQVQPVPGRVAPPTWPLSYRTALLPELPAEQGQSSGRSGTGGLPIGIEGEAADHVGGGAAAAGEVPERVTDSGDVWAEAVNTGAAAAGEVPGGVTDPDLAGGDAIGRRVTAGGFAEGEVLDGAPGGITLAEFADGAHAELTAVDDDSLIGLMRGWRRITSWAQARELAVVAELARRRPADGYPPAPPGQIPAKLSEFVAEEIAPPLTLTARAADTELALALDLASRPKTAAALESGQIDMAKTLIILSALAPLEPAHAEAVEAAILAVAAGLTTGQLRARLQRLILSVDPGAARRRRENAEKQARVECWTDPEGTATLAGRNLPPAQVLAADRRLCAIAAAWKKLGAQGGMDMLRAHAYLALLLGRDTSTPPPSLLPQAGSPASRARASGHPGGSGPGRTSREREDQPNRCSQSVPAGLRGLGSGDALPPATGSVHVTIPLLTLLGLADRPGEAAGFGPLHADICRTLADAMAGHRATRWGVIITDPHGRAMGLGGPALARHGRKGAADNARGSPVVGAARGSPPSPGAGGWTVTLTTEPIAPYP